VLWEKKYRFNEKSTLHIADSYKKAGDPAFTRYLGITNTEREVEKQSAVYVTIPSYAFALEAYLKTIVYCNIETTLTVLDLAKIPWGLLCLFNGFPRCPGHCWVIPPAGFRSVNRLVSVDCESSSRRLSSACRSWIINQWLLWKLAWCGFIAPKELFSLNKANQPDVFAFSCLHIKT